MEGSPDLFNIELGTPVNGLSELPAHWRIARAAHVSFLLMGMPRVNLLLIGVDGRTWKNVVETRLLELHEPVATWWPDEPLALPPVQRISTMVLHDVDVLTADEQRILLSWLEGAAGRIQVISTSVTPLLPRVKDGTFAEALYYRLNTMCVDLSA